MNWAMLSALVRRSEKSPAALVRGEISVAEAMRKRLALLKGMERHLLKSVYEERISLKSGAHAHLFKPCVITEHFVFSFPEDSLFLPAASPNTSGSTTIMETSWRLRTGS